MSTEKCKICSGKGHSLPYCMWQNVKALFQDIASLTKNNFKFDANICEVCHQTGHKHICKQCPHYYGIPDETTVNKSAYMSKKGEFETSLLLPLNQTFITYDGEND